MRNPILVGVADIKNRSTKPEDAIEPLHLISRAVQDALNDTGLPPSNINKLRASIDAISVVRTWTWPYADLPGLLSNELGIKPKHKHYTAHGGNQPAKLADDAARRIAKGESVMEVIAGGEALGSLAACAAAGQILPPGWTAPSEDLASATALDLTKFGDNVGTRHSVGLPIHVYPFYENAYRAHYGQSIEENNDESMKLYEQFARIAAQNPNSWNYGRAPLSAGAIGKVSKSNRMICFPYPLLMNAFNNVNLAAACVLTSVEYAEKLGIPKDRWVYILGGAGTQDSDKFWERPNYYTSPSISQTLDAAFECSGINKNDVDLFDIYSCFPIVPKLACQHMGMSVTQPSKPLTLLGGLTSFGGAGNNYSMHSITEMTRQLRKGHGKTGLVLANGGVVTYQHAICVSSHPRGDGNGYAFSNPLPDVIRDISVPELSEEAEGEASIETYTVEYERDGSLLRGCIIGRLESDGKRFVANHGDLRTLQQLASNTREPIGRKGRVKHLIDEKRNVFFFDEYAKI